MAKILIVDDSSFIRTIMKSLLVEGGYEDVIEATTGKEAIEKFNEESPDLIMMDIIMPDMDGIEALKELGRRAKVCMVTAVGQEDMIEKAKEAGAENYVTKPFDNEKILSVVKEMLG